MAKLTENASRIRELVREYAQERHLYAGYARLLAFALEQARAELAPNALVQARAKTISSFAEKVARRLADVRDPLRDFTDLCGARIVVLTRQEVQAARRFVATRFELDLERSQDVSERLAVSEFGYESIHCIVRLRPEVFLDAEGPLYVPTTLERRELEGLLEEIADRQAEIQIRTLLEHAWAEVAHDRLYKARIRVPRPWARRLHGMAALMQTANREFSASASVIDDFLQNYELHLPRAELEHELEALHLVFESEATPELALRLARLARVACRWDVVVDAARAQRERAVRFRRELDAELGHALCSRRRDGEEAEGEAILREIGRPDEIELGEPSALDVERDELRARALGWLAQSVESTVGSGYVAVLDLYRKASLCDPENPYLLAAHLERLAMRERELDAVAGAHHQIRAAIARCREHAKVGIAVPDCYFAVGKLHLLLQQYAAAIDAYARAIAVSELAAPIEAEANTLAKLEEQLRRPAPELGCARLSLQLGGASKRLAARQPDAAARATDERLARATDELLARATDERLARAAVERLARESAIEPREIRRPIVLVAGAAAPMADAARDRYLGILRAAFAGFDGTIYSGGTTAGVPGIVGTLVAELREQGSSADAVAYVPKSFPPEGPRDERYTRLPATDTADFSPLQPLCTWIELLRAGVDPAEVRLLGISGGEIAAFEYRLALALGATVGLVAGSGRAVAKLQEDDMPWPGERLLFLPDDAMTICAFVRRPSRQLLAAEQLDSAARAVHEKYLADNKEKRFAAANFAGWDELREDLRQSNREQAAYAAEILASEGYELVDAAAVPMAQRVKTFTKDDEVRRMAEREHGRWNVERLAAGWRFGVAKDAERRISPYLVNWEDLPPEIQSYDLKAVRDWPEVFGSVGLAIRRKEAASPRTDGGAR